MPDFEVVVIVDGEQGPVWGLRAGQRIIATEYDHDARRITVSVESDPDKSKVTFRYEVPTRIEVNGRVSKRLIRKLAAREQASK